MEVVMLDVAIAYAYALPFAAQRSLAAFANRVSLSTQKANHIPPHLPFADWMMITY
jgi:hypothetical protein